MEEDSIDSLVQLVLPLCLVPSPPVNVSAVLSIDLSTSESTLTVGWSPPLYNNAPILHYRVEYSPSKDDQQELFTVSS